MRSDTGSDAQTRLLLLERNPEGCQTAVRDLKECLGANTEIVSADSGRAACALLRAGSFDILVVDLDSLADISPQPEVAMNRLCRLAEGGLIIALSDGRSVSSAVAAMRAGAHDYIPKPICGPAFAARVEELAQRHGKAGAMQIDTSAVGADADFESFVGLSNQMRVVYEQISRIAPSTAPVFITGESGTGKEVCAEALHRRGPRADKPLIAVNCGAIPRDLMETELFGAVRGAYTGAVRDRQGAAELADGGTLFLDEIGEMDLSLQTKLLRFLQTGTITRVGEGVARPVDVRVICATNRNPMQLIAERRFREDLFYRLHVLPIHLPPLRQRPADILPLARHFLAQFAREEHKHFACISAQAADMLVAREWPGNVRQVQNMIRRIVVMFDGREITPEMIAVADIEGHAAARPALTDANATPKILPMWQQEQRIIEDTVAHFSGNIAQAAAALEISPSTIYRKRQAWEQMEHRLAGAA